MDAKMLVEQLVSLPDLADQRAFLAAHVAFLDDSFADALKAKADSLRHSDLQRSLRTAELLCYLSELTGNPCHRALGLLAEANARSIGLGKYAQAIELYDEAAEVYASFGKVVDQAKTQVGKIYALGNLGHYEEARAVGEAAARVLESNSEWKPLASLTMNLAIVLCRQGDDEGALRTFDRARDFYTKSGSEGAEALPWIEHNRAISLRNLGRFEASIQASLASQEMLARLGQQIEVARSQQNLAITYFVLGRFNEALVLLDQARDVFYGDGRERDAVLVDLFTSDCLLQLRRFADVLIKCKQVRDLFSKLGTRFEVAQAILNEATAYAGLGRHVEAEASLREARRLFEAENNSVWVALTDLERAIVLQAQGQHGASLALCQVCIGILHRYNLPVEEAQSCLVAAKVMVALRRYDEARDLTARALEFGTSENILALTYQACHLKGIIAQAEDKPHEAMLEYDRAIEQLERLRRQLMVEFRAAFVEDKQILYEDVIGLCLTLGLPERGLEYAERAKSRALLDLLACRLDLQIQPKDPSDHPLIEQLMRLRQERDRLYRRRDTEEGFETRGSISLSDEMHQASQDVQELERHITDLWHRLLIRHADYARSADLWRVQTAPVQPYLDENTLLLEYFTIGHQPLAFLVTRDSVEARRLPTNMSQIQNLMQLFRFNIDASSRSDPAHVVGLIPNARWLLSELHNALLAPLSDILEHYTQLIIVPHGSLHYLPFHACFDGTSYLLERHVVSYLPASSLLRYCHEDRPTSSGRAAFGHSHGGLLPFAVEESAAVAALLRGSTIVEDEATPKRVREVAPECGILHLAAHGDFRPDNPLFSGLALTDGWLTTLDIFNLHLNASLVTLSACQTGQSVIGGGDELFGLMRAFLYAGAASLVLSLWAVEDRSTEQLMTSFYQALVAGQSKGAALREAQLSFVRRSGQEQDPVDGARAHPYFWAPFFLVGHCGPLT